MCLEVARISPPTWRIWWATSAMAVHDRKHTDNTNACTCGVSCNERAHTFELQEVAYNCACGIQTNGDRQKVTYLEQHQTMRRPQRRRRRLRCLSQYQNLNRLWRFHTSGNNHTKSGCHHDPPPWQTLLPPRQLTCRVHSKQTKPARWCRLQVSR